MVTDFNTASGRQHHCRCLLPSGCLHDQKSNLYNTSEFLNLSPTNTPKRKPNLNLNLNIFKEHKLNRKTHSKKLKLSQKII